MASLPSGKSSRYSVTHTAQLRDVLILSPSRFMNSLAGTLVGRLYPPCSLSKIGKMMQWKTMLSLPMKCRSSALGSCHQTLQSCPWASHHSMVAVM